MRIASLIVAIAVAASPAAALAQHPGGGYGGMGSSGYGMGGGMMHGSGQPGAGMGPGTMGGRVQPGSGEAGPADSPSRLTEDQARGLAQQYADQYLKGYTVDKVLPFGTPAGTAYSVELRGPKHEIRVLHVNPEGDVRPLRGASGRAG